MSQLCLITVPGLDVRFDWQRVHDRLLDEFPAVTDVLATTIRETVLVIHDGAPDSAWIQTASAAALTASRRGDPGTAWTGPETTRRRDCGL